ncbi:gamma-glutamyltransferase family protein [Sphingomicrobium nitratireducens]|uniref:gamma-glutamyltransferase family protein n=1 Tax=Sphingomicrobium nitratireducens TaxID=2964666 RepID=UPI00223F46FE|nr:gamma-glutamyltransferase family protein [Sphingomicrobium nitratireducens]
MPLRSLLVLFALLLGSCATVPASAPNREKAFVIAANPLAAKAGMDVLERGGSAIDAAVAIQAMLSLVEPQSSGVGGGAFIHYLDASSGRAIVYDGREVAPAQATASMFLDANGEKLDAKGAALTGRAVGVPGAVAALHHAHRRHGRLAWNSLFGSAIAAARDGFVVSPRLGSFLPRSDILQLTQPDAIAYFSDGQGRRLETGDRLVNAAYADFLERLAAQGPDALLKGETAARIVEKTRSGPLGGTMTMADLANYKVVEREPLCTWYEATRICAPPPPSSGVGFLQLMELLERTAISELGPDDPRAWYLLAEASRLMYADRDHFVGDSPDVPVAGLLDPAYLDTRADLIVPRASANVVHGIPAGAPTHAPDATREMAGTSHFIVRDAAGNVVSMTTTVEAVFGSGLMVDGFFLNNQMTDFDFSPVDEDGHRSSNAVTPGKRPRSSMVPLLLYDADGNFAGAAGSAGGSSILAYVGKSLVAALDWGLPMQDAIALPNLVARDNETGAEATLDPRIVRDLSARGLVVTDLGGEGSGVHAVLVREDGRIDGGYDPRREGVVLIAN